MSWLELVIIALATYRLTRLLIEDEILAGPRTRLLGQLDQEGKLRYLLGCYWCLGLWVSLLITAFFAPTILLWLVVSLATSALVGLLAERV
jgi:hypothetical protein